MDVLTAAWLGSGSPTQDSLRQLGQGPCARCGADTLLSPVTAAVSKTFTGFDGWHDVAGRGLCPVCSWGYTTADLRQAAHQVDRAQVSLTRMTSSDVASQLLHGGLATDVALVVPLRLGRKHLLPSARWGRITVDDAQLIWTSRESDLLEDVIQLRQHGFGTRMLREPAPPFSILRRLPTRSWSNVVDAWHRLTTWRSPDNPWLSLALHITTP